jgi:hypothetical protein
MSSNPVEEGQKQNKMSAQNLKNRLPLSTMIGYIGVFEQISLCLSRSQNNISDSILFLLKFM